VQRQQLIDAYREATQAKVNSRWLYSQLADAIKAGKYQLNQPYNGLQIKSIWEAKPVAWRPVPIFQYDFRLPEGTPEPNWEIEADLLHDFFKAYCIEKEAWSKFTAIYIEAVYEWLQNPEKDPPAAGDPSHFKIYEVKPC